MIVRRSSAEQVARRLGFLLDAIGLLVLANAGETPLWIFAIPVASLTLHLFTRWSARTWFLVAALASCVGAAAYLWLHIKVHPVTAAAATVPIAHSILWLAPRESAYRGWRMGMGFLELIVASAITPEIYLPLAIIAYVVIASVARSCDFLDQELSKRAPARRLNPLPPLYIRKSFLLSFLIFLSSAIIFPILPRYDDAGLRGLGPLAAGYTESVSLSRWGSRPDTDSGRALLNLFPPPNVDLNFEIYLGLLRSRALESFDGKSWTPVSSRLAKSYPSTPRNPKERNPLQVEVVREANESGALPVPYGTQAVHLIRGGTTIPTPGPRVDATWLDVMTAGSRVRYLVEFDPLHPLSGSVSIPDDRNRDLLLHVPEKLRTEPMLRLARQIFADAITDQDRIRAILNFYRLERFTTIQSPSTEFVAQQLEKSKLAPIEQFLFVTQEGHCEWFASSAAVLLRLAGVPTRLIAGFRISTSKMGNVLTLRSGDAHAWLEAYTKERGWVPVDPTPRVFGETSLLGFISQVADVARAYWFKYVVSFERSTPGFGKSPLVSRLNEDSGKSAGLVSKIPSLVWGGLSVFIGFALWTARRTGFWRMRGRPRESTPRWLRAERARMERSLRQIRKRSEQTPERDFWKLLDSSWLGKDASEDLEQWKAIYLSHRFRGGLPADPGPLLKVGRAFRRRHRR